VNKRAVFSSISGWHWQGSAHVKPSIVSFWYKLFIKCWWFCLGSFVVECCRVYYQLQHSIMSFMDALMSWDLEG